MVLMDRETWLERLILTSGQKARTIRRNGRYRPSLVELEEEQAAACRGVTVLLLTRRQASHPLLQLRRGVVGSLMGALRGLLYPLYHRPTMHRCVGRADVVLLHRLQILLDVD